MSRNQILASRRVWGANTPGQDGGGSVADAPGLAELGDTGLRRWELQPGPRARGLEWIKIYGLRVASGNKGLRLSGWGRTFEGGGSGALVFARSVGGAVVWAGFRSPGVFPPLFFFALYERTNTGRKGFVVIVDAEERHWASGVTQTRPISIRLLCDPESTHLSYCQFPPL